MTFSVVIPAFNAAATIRQALSSCMQQSFPSLEIIVVDDASTDGTARLVKEAGSAVRLIRLEENKGVSHARNAGWQAACGDYIAFLDSDDEWHPEKLAILAEHLERWPGKKLIFHPYTVEPFHLPAGGRLCSLAPYPFGRLLFQNQLQSSCICVDRQLELRFNERFRYCEDHELALRVAAKYGCYRLPLALTRLSRPQLSGGGLSGSRWSMRKGELRMYLGLGRIRAWLIPLIPFLIVFSLLKYAWKQLSNRPA